jgi:hypothetical protein
MLRASGKAKGAGMTQVLKGTASDTANVRLHNDLNVIFKEMLEASGIPIIETLSSGDGSITFSEVITVGN